MEETKSQRQSQHARLGQRGIRVGKLQFEHQVSIRVGAVRNPRLKCEGGGRDGGWGRFGFRPTSTDEWTQANICLGQASSRVLQTIGDCARWWWGKNLASMNLVVTHLYGGIFDLVGIH